MVEGDGYVAGVTHDINDPWIVRLETLVTFEDTRAWKGAHATVGLKVDFRDARLDVGEGNGFILVDEVADEKARPRIARPGVRRQEHIVGEDGQVAPGNLTTCEDKADLGNDLCRLPENLSRVLCHRS